jgi:hypothetical protein
MPFFEKKVDSSKLATMLKKEINASHDSSGSQASAVDREPGIRKSYITGDTNISPDTVIGGKIVRETPVNVSSCLRFSDAVC